ncbi:carboxypeptidase-like regulatory domain-containing protein [Halobacterium noricense]|uniref:carboxypeptidase-like regulatory domain-containing protein n=1 Tax=Halobacterium noricense TaxID=223182 RepID=UPI001E44B068|nr:carboxypeptidase-like regulatory domain-containing protein [Halobacterium noricense]UHH25566.1 carboxypeptidase-like regulatory domain-containing protein [Halobacterium noricense]
MFDSNPLRLDQFARDERAIEGLPVRLVIAFVVGVATLSVMLSMVSGVDTLSVSELDASPEPDVVTPGDQSVDVTAVDADGDPVAGATVVVKAGTADLDGVATATTGDDGTATLDIDPQLGPNQADGTLEISVKPPSGSDYADRRENTEILVVRD